MRFARILASLTLLAFTLTPVLAPLAKADWNFPLDRVLRWAEEHKEEFGPVRNWLRVVDAFRGPGGATLL